MTEGPKYMNRSFYAAFVTESSRLKSAVKEHEKRHYVTSGADHIDMCLEVACGEGILKSVYPPKAYQNCETL
jgi:hypothetical protein